ncbi:TetR/AcrR family transcriptional regulator [Rhodococcus sp. SORGH_AS_0301]|uniref:TetR/AcrR family transcriptional regulator n=1 Tax=Rhodococcus sp. SORGH_AS_0301 TaxID=3041780 RepID=UPI0027826AAE|nr:TetR/AcrR family transcriptional regulator [Rhodococcus sp. SORGH_AS_0301]MDQ1178571.1 AcrR family transcriptional regulator [Rhodococcus sp. SORGH_AS_0301]
MSDPISNRERNAARRRRAIHLAGMKLFAENGYHQTSVAEVASASNLAPRTVSYYFASKHDIALATCDEASERLTKAIEKLASGGCVVAAIIAWLTAEPEHVDPELWHHRHAMFLANPELAYGSLRLSANHISALGSAFERQYGVPCNKIDVGIVVGAIDGILVQHYRACSDIRTHHAFIAIAKAAMVGVAEVVLNHVEP